MSSPAVSHHLRPLRNSSLIVSRREGKKVYYRSADTPQSQLLHQMINCLTEYQSEQIEIIRKIHKQLAEHMEQRFTIESLSKQYLINPTTLKTMFK